MGQLTQKQSEFLKSYNGGNKFILSLKAQFIRGEKLTDRQVSYVGTFAENYALREAKGLPEATSEIVVEPKLEIESNSLFSLETLEESASEAQETKTPMLDGIEETLRKLAAQVVTDTMKQANEKANVILARAEKLAATNSKVMHVKLGNIEVKKLTHEAHPQLAEIITAMEIGKQRDKMLWLVGPTGSGKTTLAKQIAEAKGLNFGHVSYSMGASETWLTGRQSPVGYISAPFVELYKNGGVFLGDEQDSADSNLMVFLNAALGNGFFTNPQTGEELKMHKDFYYIAAANTFGSGANSQYTGRSRLDKATLDRFFFVSIDYNEKLEAMLCPDSKLLKVLHKARKKLIERNAEQIISTRSISFAYGAITAGFPKEKAFSLAFAESWPKGLAEEIGLFSKESSEEIPF